MAPCMWYAGSNSTYDSCGTNDNYTLALNVAGVKGSPAAVCVCNDYTTKPHATVVVATTNMHNVHGLHTRTVWTGVSRGVKGICDDVWAGSVI